MPQMRWLLCGALQLLVTTSAAAASAAAAPAASAQGVVFPGAMPGRQWALGARAHPSSLLTVHAMFRHRPSHVRRLEQALYSVSDPLSPQYGQHLTRAQIRRLLPISLEAIATVQGFFSGQRATESTLSMYKDVLSVTLSVTAAERLLNTTFHAFHHRGSGASVLRAGRPFYLPAAVADCLYTLADVSLLPGLRTPLTSHLSAAPRAAPAAPLTHLGNWSNACPSIPWCKGLITPAVLHQRYAVPTNASGMQARNNSMAVAEFQGEYFKQSDLDAFSAACGMDVNVTTVIGGNEQKAGVESELDIDYIKGLSPSIPLTLIYAKEFSLIDWITSVTAMENPPLVHSVSYGNDEVQMPSAGYMQACNVQFMKAGARGLSLLFASGDSGVCGQMGCDNFNLTFHPDFPASSPYITAVGGTDFVTFNIGEEKAWDYSGGGFSNTFPIPPYQAAVVAAYKANTSANLPPQQAWNNTGRGYPDIAALGGEKTPYCIVDNGFPKGISGTSASCPTVASIFARLNGLRLLQGKSPLGWLNPFIYQNADAFNDVTAGCNTADTPKKNCFRAIRGWDASTGVGTPDFARLKTKV